METMHTLSNTTFNNAGAAYIAYYGQLKRTLPSVQSKEKDITGRTCELDAAVDTLLGEGHRFLLQRHELAHVQKVFSDTLSEECQLPTDPNVNCNFTLNSREIPAAAKDVVTAFFFNMRNRIQHSPTEYQLALAQLITIVPDFDITFNFGRDIAYVTVKLNGDRNTDAMQKAWALVLDTDTQRVADQAIIDRLYDEESVYNSITQISTFGCESVQIPNHLYAVLLPYITE